MGISWKRATARAGPQQQPQPRFAARMKASWRCAAHLFQLAHNPPISRRRENGESEKRAGEARKGKNHWEINMLRDLDAMRLQFALNYINKSITYTDFYFHISIGPARDANIASARESEAAAMNENGNGIHFACNIASSTRCNRSLVKGAWFARFDSDLDECAESINRPVRLMKSLLRSDGKPKPRNRWVTSGFGCANPINHFHRRRRVCLRWAVERAKPRTSATLFAHFVQMCH